MSTVDEIEREILDAARDVSQMDSAMLLRRDAFGRWVPSRAVGPLAGGLYEAPPETIAQIEAFVAAGTSCYTVAQPDGDVADGMRALRAAGAEALVALQLCIAGAPWGILVVADPRPLAPATDEVELLELLVAHAVSCLRTSEAVGELRERAARDPLTGLGHHGTFHEALSAARRRSDVAVLMIDVDGFKAINDNRGHQAGDRVLVEVSAALSSALRRGDELFRIGGDEFAAIVAVAEEAEALDAGRRLREAAAATGTVTVSVGVAIPLHGEADAAVLARADRALYSVKAQGRDGVSLEG
jgi:diguanylate cyclase (GGDEF)-like protein